MARSPALSIVTPTVGRDTLRALVESAEGTKWNPNDEWLIIGDSQRKLPDWLADYASSLPRPIKYLEHNTPGSCCGNAQRNYAITIARQGNYLVWADDNDVFLPGAINIIRENLPKQPQPTQFEVTWGATYRACSDYVPMNPGEGNWEAAGGGQQFVTPNLPDMVPKWPNTGSSDYNFVTDTLRLWGGPDAMLRVPILIMHTT